LGALILSGCSSAHYRRSADKEVYRIIQQVENGIFGRTNEFTIETPYSARKPKDIPAIELIEDRLQTNRRVLTIEGALELAATRSRQYQAEKERLYLTALTLTGARYQFTPQFFANSRARFERDALGERIGTVNSQVGVDQLVKSGGRLGVSLANDILRYYTGDPRRSVISALSVNLVQPLLRGFGRNNAAVESLTQAERNVVYAVRNYSYFQDQFALEIVSDYFALLAQKDAIRNRYTNFMNLGLSTKRLEARAKDREALVDVDQARQDELSSKNTYVNAVANYRTSLDQFKIKLGLPLGEQILLEDQSLKELEQIGLIDVILDPQEAYRIAVKKQLTILNAIDSFEDSKRKVRVSADRLKADLNLLADASLASDEPTDYTTFDPDKIRAGVGLELDLPIDRLTERNDYRSTLVSFESELRSLTLVLDQLRDSIQRGLRTVAQRRQNCEIQSNALVLANRRVASTTLLLEAGRVEVRNLLEAHESLINVQNSLIAARVDYNLARLQLMLDIGALNKDLPQFWLKDHLPGFLPGSAPAATTTDDRLLTPEEYFNN
jgi:outer membrane protein TolC